MAIPACVVATARATWHWQWLRLMAGLGPADAEGNYRRPAGAFSTCPPLPTTAGERGGHVLIVGRSCPWAHRARLVWGLRQLQDTIELLVVEPDPQAGRWRFVTPFQDCRTLLELYRLAGADPRQRATVPVLFSLSEQRIVVGESARLIELLNDWPAPAGALNLQSEATKTACNQWRQRFQGAVNDGVYRCGFARSQAAYDRAEAELFAALAEAESALAAGGPWLCGEELTLADLQLFATLIRWELVYAPLFGCSRQPLWQLATLWAWRARLFALPGVAESCDGEAWRRDYFGALFPLHPSGIVPAGPDLARLVSAIPMR